MILLKIQGDINTNSLVTYGQIEWFSRTNPIPQTRRCMEMSFSVFQDIKRYIPLRVHNGGQI